MCDATSLFDALKERGWKVQLRAEPAMLPLRVRSRYPVQSERIGPLLERIVRCSNPADTSWIFAPANYEEGEPYSFDTYESMSLESTRTPTERSEVSAFWDQHLIFMTNVESAYDYLALRADGAVVHGYAPEFELATLVSSSLAEFVRNLELQARRQQNEWPYDLFLGDESVV